MVAASKLGKKKQVQLVLPGTFIFLLRAVSRKTGSWQQARSAPKLSKKKQLQLALPGTILYRMSTGRQVGDKTPEPALQLASDHRDWETSGQHHPAASSRQAGDTTQSRRHSIWHLTESDRTDWDKLAPRHRETSDRHNPAAGVTASGVRPQGDKRETRPRRNLTATTPGPASQHLASDRKHWETQGEKRETRPWSQRHSI